MGVGTRCALLLTLSCASCSETAATSAADAGPRTEAAPHFYDDEPCSEDAPPGVGGCLPDEPKPIPGFASSENLKTFSGTIVGIETEAPASDCYVPPVQAYTVRIAQEDASDVRVVLALGPLPLSLAEGDVVTLGVHGEQAEFPRRRHYSIVKDGVEMVHVATSDDGRFEGEPSHVVSTRAGKLTCEGPAYCGQVERHDLVASDGTESVDVPAGVATRVGAYLVYTSGAVVRDEKRSCGDWNSSTSVAWVRAGAAEATP